MDLPFCLFLMLVIFLSLAPPTEPNGRRAGEAIAVTAVMLSFWPKVVVLLLLCFGLRGMCEENAVISCSEGQSPRG